jgi:hypothetical protein
MPYIDSVVSLNGDSSTGVFACFLDPLQKRGGYDMPYFECSTLDTIARHFTKSHAEYAFHVDWQNSLVIRPSGIENLYEDEIEIDGEYGWGYALHAWPWVVVPGPDKQTSYERTTKTYLDWFSLLNVRG